MFFFAKALNAQCDSTNRNKVILASLNYFQDSINRRMANILLAETTQYLQHPPYNSFEPDLKLAIPDTSILADLIVGFGKIFKNKTSLSALESCTRISLMRQKMISEIHDWKKFYNSNPNTTGYYTVTLPFVTKSHAIIYIENFCGDLCGSGYILYLNYRQDINEWKVIYYRQTWVS